MRNIWQRIEPHLRYGILKRIIREHDRSFYRLTQEKWSIGLLREYLKAQKYAAAIMPESIHRVFIFSYSRSGTHNFLSRFHYLKCAFVIRENLFVLPDSQQFQVCPEDLRPRHFMLQSMFDKHGLQDKKGNELSHLFFPNNYYLNETSPLEIHELRPEKDKVIYYVRNFLRVLYSRDKAGRKQSKHHFVMTDDNFIEALHQHREKLEEMLQLQDSYPDIVRFCFHELFCAQTKEVFNSLSEFIGISLELRYGWNNPEHFFKQCFATGKSPVLKDGRLWCPYPNEWIYGTGGDFNPLPEVSLSRTLSEPIENLMNKSRLQLARALFGDQLVDFWLNDAEFDYHRATDDRLLEIIRTSLATCKSGI